MQSTKPQILFPTLTIIFCCYESNHNQQSERTSKEKEKKSIFLLKERIIKI
jgi:hypothetical protein